MTLSSYNGAGSNNVLRARHVPDTTLAENILRGKYYTVNLFNFRYLLLMKYRMMVLK